MEQENLKPRQLIEALSYFVPLFFLGLIIVYLNVTNPLSVGPIGILGIFVLLYLVTVSVAYLFLKVLFRLNIKLFRGVNLKKSYLLASIISFIPVLAVGLNTLGQLGVMEIALISILSLLASFYVFKSR